MHYGALEMHCYAKPMWISLQWSHYGRGKHCAFSIALVLLTYCALQWLMWVHCKLHCNSCTMDSTVQYIAFFCALHTVQCTACITLHCILLLIVHWAVSNVHCNGYTVAEDSSGIRGIKTDPLFQGPPPLALCTLLWFSLILWKILEIYWKWWEMWRWRNVNYEFSINSNLPHSAFSWLSHLQSLRSHLAGWISR